LSFRTIYLLQDCLMFLKYLREEICQIDSDRILEYFLTPEVSDIYIYYIDKNDFCPVIKIWNEQLFSRLFTYFRLNCIKKQWKMSIQCSHAIRGIFWDQHIRGKTVILSARPSSHNKTMKLGLFGQDSPFCK